MAELESNVDVLAAKLKEIVDVKGPYYLIKKPYSVYLSIIDDHSVDKRLADAFLYLLIRGILNDISLKSDRNEISQFIQKECSLFESIADCLADVIIKLYSDENRKEWESKIKRD